MPRFARVEESHNRKSDDLQGVAAFATDPYEGSGESALTQQEVVMSFTISVTTLSPILALLAGILILLVPRLLNYVVGFYLLSVYVASWVIAEACQRRKA